MKSYIWAIHYNNQGILRYKGEVVCLYAYPTRAQAREGLRLVRHEYTHLNKNLFIIKKYRELL